MRRTNTLRLLGTIVTAMAVFVVSFLTPLYAQVDTGSITGAVTDASGALITGARVTLTNAETGAALTTTTGSDGIYKFSPVRIGTYKLDTASQGFKTVSQAGIKVEIGANVVVNFSLNPGSTSETVEVTAAPPVLQTQDASVGQVVDQRNVNNLPLNGRNFTFLAQLVQGVNSPQPDTRGNAASGAFAANGFRPAQNNYMIDGIDNNSDTVDFLNGTNFVVLPPVDAVQEFKVQTTDFSAEYGRSGAAVLNASIKSGTNQFHGSAWEFFRHDKLDAADFFERNKLPDGTTQTTKGVLRWNQYGGTIGGPVVRNKIFFFGDYEGFRRRQGTVLPGSVPTAAERASGYTNFQDLITGQSGTITDALNRTFLKGTVFDPATTRPVGSSFVRDPFGFSTCTGTTYNLTTCPGLNILPANRLDPNAIKLMNLYPAPTSSGLGLNFVTSPVLKEDRKAFDTRLDIDFTQKDQLFYRFSYVDDPELIPSIFGGAADGGGFFQGNQTALAQQSALVWTHAFNPSTINVARGGLNYLHTTRNIPASNDLTNLPGTYGIQGVPQIKENGGLPRFDINGLQNLGGNSFLPSDEVTSTFQVTDDFTKIYGKHTFKSGFEWQHVKFSTLQPPWSRGEFNFGGNYTDVPDIRGGNTGRAQFLLTPMAATVPGGVNYVGGPQDWRVSNIALTDNGKNYYGLYLQDDWKATTKLTLNLGLRWDFFGLVYEHHAAQANFVPFGPPTGGPMYILPVSAAAQNNLAPSFSSLLANNGIALAVTNRYGRGLGNSQNTNFAPRFGFAYQVTPKFVARGGFGIFYNGFENRGFSPNIGENYPYQFDFHFASTSDGQPITQFAGCTAATATGGPTLETGFACSPLSPLLVIPSGLTLRGIQFNYQTPYSMGGNFTLQYQITPTLAFQAGYVTTLARHLEVFPGSNLPTQLLPVGTKLTNPKAISAAQGGLPFPDFAQGSSYATTQGSSYYHGLQTKVEKQLGNGLNFLVAYTYSKVRSDAYDLLNGFGSGGGYRAPYVPGIGIRADYGLANFDIRNVVHLSGGYELPLGKGKRLMGDATGVKNAFLGGWSLQWISTLQGGQPFQLGCPSGTTSGTNCLSFVLPGQNPRTSIHINPDGNPAMLNAAAFAQPCQMGSAKPAGCIPLTGVGLLGGALPSQIAGPPLKRLDLSLFKNFPIRERARVEFRSEFFNIFNHPTFNPPGFGGNGVNAVTGSTDFGSKFFGEIGATRNSPFDAREIQFALKVYF